MASEWQVQADELVGSGSLVAALCHCRSVGGRIPPDIPGFSCVATAVGAVWILSDVPPVFAYIDLPSDLDTKGSDKGELLLYFLRLSRGLDGIGVATGGVTNFGDAVLELSLERATLTTEHDEFLGAYAPEGLHHTRGEALLLGLADILHEYGKDAVIGLNGRLLLVLLGDVLSGLLRILLHEFNSDPSKQFHVLRLVWRRSCFALPGRNSVRCGVGTIVIIS